MDIKGVATKFAGRGELEKAYNFAMNDLSKAIKSLSEKGKNKKRDIINLIKVVHVYNELLEKINKYRTAEKM